uniref:Ig-like domain-containing protein n=1 Tax=Monodelphis domestica TaxID=13616 RepID=F6RJJ9_MONDO
LGKWRLFCYVAICLLGVGHMDTGVIQNPRYLVKGSGKKLTLRCEQNMKHDYMSWYREDPGLGLRLIHYSQDINLIAPGDIPEGFTVSRLKTDQFPLTLESTSPSHTSVYHCASAKAQPCAVSSSLCTNLSTGSRMGVELRPHLLPHFADEEMEAPEGKLSGSQCQRWDLTVIPLFVLQL